MTSEADNWKDIWTCDIRLSGEYVVYHASEGVVRAEIDARIERLRRRGYLHLPPFSSALVATHEWFNVPNRVYGRWGLKIKPALSGLFFQAGPHVEGGYRGRLFGLLFNLSNQDREFKFGSDGDFLWQIDFTSNGRSPKENAATNPPLLAMNRFAPIQPGASLSSIVMHQEEVIRELGAYRQKATEVLNTRTGQWFAALIAIVTIVSTLAASSILPIIVANIQDVKQDARASLEESANRFIRIEGQKVDLANTAARVEWVRAISAHAQVLRQALSEIESRNPESLEATTLKAEIEADQKMLKTLQ